MKGYVTRNVSFALTCLAVLTTCHRVERLSSASAIGQLEGRCVELRQPMFLLESGGSKSADTYLSPVTDGGNAGQGALTRVEAGQQFVVNRVLLETTFEDRQVNVVSDGRENRSVALTLLFRPAWLAAARRTASGSTADSVRSIDDALDPKLAKWCDAR